MGPLFLTFRPSISLLFRDYMVGITDCFGDMEYLRDWGNSSDTVYYDML